MISGKKRRRLEAAAQLARLQEDCNRMRRQLRELDLWLPATGLQRQADQIIQWLEVIDQRLDLPLVVTLVGPTGAGKSTLFNALAGKDELSPTGYERPTTRKIKVLCRRAEDAAAVLGPDRQAAWDVISAKGSFPDQVILMDTPDTDSVAASGHLELIKRAIGISDVLICVFDAENPKRRDHADFLAPWINLFSGTSLVVVLNKCDRQDQTELTESILPGFRHYLEEAWQVPVDRLLAVSARSHLKDPAWEPGLRPRHAQDQFEQLHQLVWGNLARPLSAVRTRLANARHLRDYLATAIRQEADKARKQLAKALEDAGSLESMALGHSLDALASDAESLTQGTRIRLYQLLARGWVGPVGWIVAIWSRLLIFGAGAISLLRPGRPFQQAAGLVGALRHRAASKEKSARAADPEVATAALQAFRSTVLRRWPQTADLLVEAGFDPRVRDPEPVIGAATKLAETISGAWIVALDQRLQKAAARLQNGLLQFILNLPPLVALVWAGWLTLLHFVKGSYLAADFFIHFLAVEIILVLAGFFIIQMAVQFTVRKGRLQRQAFARLQSESGRPGVFDSLEVIRQATIVRKLVNDYREFEPD